MNQTEETIQAQKRAEQFFAGAAFIDPTRAVESCGWLDPRVIQDERIRRYWANLLGKYRGNAYGAAMEASCFTDIIGWSTDLPPGGSCYPESFAREIQRRSYLISLDPLITKLLVARQDHDVDQLRAVTERLYQSAPASVEHIPDAADVGVEFMALLATPEKLSIKTRIPPLDDCLGGLERRVNYVLAARPSLGKSTLAFQIARNMARDGHKALYFSLEMGRVQLWAKAACGYVGVAWRDVREKRITSEQLEEVNQATSELIEAYQDRLLIDDRTGHSTQSLWQIVSTEKPDLVIVDVMARLKDRHESEVKRLGNIAYTLREMGKELNCATLVLHHVNRETETRKDKRPTLANLRDSGEIEQAADVVILLHSPDAYETTTKPPVYRKTDAIIAKDRDGVMNKVIHLAFDTGAQWFLPASAVDFKNDTRSLLFGDDMRGKG